MDTEETKNVLVEALPPKTDYLTYLTLLEYNLRKEDLGILHELLQDQRLVVNIGWDLVQILLPFLPESSECLQDVAALGNPREVVLKVTEELENLGSRLTAADTDSQDGSGESDAQPEDVPADSSGDVTATSPEDLDRFQTLIHMLCVLHPRIKAKKPSRFLETAIRSILTAYKTIAQSPEATRAVLMFLNRMSGSSRPAPPPRNQEPQVPSVATHSSGPDPEAQDGEEDLAENELQIGLLRTLASHLIDLHLASLTTPEMSALAWAERYVEKHFPKRQPPFRKSRTELFREVEELRLRDVLVNQILMVATSDLKMSWDMILTILEDQETSEAGLAPSVPGYLFLLAALATRNMHLGLNKHLHMPVIPVHDIISTRLLGDPGESVSAEVSPVTVDALVLTGWLAFTTEGLGCEPVDGNDEGFNKYLQKLSAVAATLDSPPLRTQMHFYLTTILHSHPSSSARLAFIDDTLQFCPFFNLKEAAIGWAKTEFVRACKETTSDITNKFAKRETLEDVAQHAFVFDSQNTSPEDVFDRLPFYHASLNFCALLCTSPILSKRLEVISVMSSLQVETSFVKALLDYTRVLKTEMGENGGAASRDWLELDLLDTNLEKAKEAIAHLQLRTRPA